MNTKAVARELECTESYVRKIHKQGLLKGRMQLHFTRRAVLKFQADVARPKRHSEGTKERIAESLRRYWAKRRGE